ncbi:MAG: endonuclease/exonuclease/phosphatase family protein [bacterium]
MTISCLSFNIWDLPIWLPKLSRKKRLAKLPQQISALAPDIICLQESFRIISRQRLLSALSHFYHYAGSLKSRWMLPLLRADRTGGVAVMSRFSFEDYEFVEHARFSRMRFDEKLGRKGFVVSLIKTAMGLIFVVNAHLYAGRSEIETDIRLQQLDGLFSYLQQHCPAEAPIILVGDFNASPTTHFPSNTQYEPTPEYERIMAEGFVDTLPHYGLENITYTGRSNVYAKLIIDASQIPKKLDYIFYRPGNKRIEAMEANVVFNNGDFLSDHNGVFCRLKISE